MERLRAAGEPVTLEEWLPKPPPDDQNFMLNPVFVRRHGFGQLTPAKPEGGYFLPTNVKVAEDDSSLPFPYEALGTSDGSGKVDMVAIAAFLPEPLRPPAGATQQQAAHAILQWIGQWEPDFAALMEAARTRPVSHLPPGSGEGGRDTRWQSVDGWLDLAKVLQLRAIAQVTAGDGAGALDSIGLMLHLGRAAAAEPEFLLNYVLSVATIALVGVPLNHCLATHLCTDAQLVEMEHLLRPIDFRADFRRALRGERFYFSRAVEEIIASDGKLFARVSPELPALALTFSPRGWWRQNQVRAVDWQLEQEQRLRTPASLRPKPKAASVTSPHDPRTVLFSLFAQAQSRRRDPHRHSRGAVHPRPHCHCTRAPSSGARGLPRGAERPRRLIPERTASRSLFGEAPEICPG